MIAAALTVLCAACGSGPPPRSGSCLGTRPPPATASSATAGSASRWPGQADRSLWLFCDTAGHHPAGQGRGLLLILGAGTAAEGPATAGRGPGALTEVTTPAVDGPGAPRVPGTAGRPWPAAAGRAAAVPARAGEPDPPGQPAALHRAARLPGPVGHRGRPRTRPVRARADQLRRLLRDGERRVHAGVVRPARLRSGGQRARSACPGVHGRRRSQLPPARRRSARRSSAAATCTCSAGAGRAAGAAGSSWPGRAPSPRGGTTGSPTSTGPARGWSADLAQRGPLTGPGAAGRVGRRLRGRRARARHDRADQRGGRLQPLAGGRRPPGPGDKTGTGRVPCTAGKQRRRPVPCADRPSGAERPERPAHLVLQPRGGSRRDSWPTRGELSADFSCWPSISAGSSGDGERHLGGRRRPAA